MISQHMQHDQESMQITSKILQFNFHPSIGNSKNDQLFNGLFNDQIKTEDQQIQDGQEFEAILFTSNNQQLNQINDDKNAKNIVKDRSAQYGQNAAKSLGNYLRKHITKRKLTHIPQLANFANRKQRNRQCKYTIEDWKEMMLNDNEHKQQCQEIVLDYLQNWAFVDILLEYKQNNPIEMIEHIQHFISGCKDPARFIEDKK